MKSQLKKSIHNSRFAILKARGAFTLIEMLIVVAIIGILASAIMVGLGPAQSKGRDARRMSDLRGAQNALELYYTQYGFYPGYNSGSNSVGIPSSCVTISDWKALATCLTTGANIVQSNNFPSTDPQGKLYCYAVSTDGADYTIGTYLENTQAGTAGSCSSANPSISSGCSANYCISF